MPVPAALHVLSAPLIWVASLCVIGLIGSFACAGTTTVVGIQLLALAGCAVVLYRALTALRASPPGSAQPRRMRYFLTGAAAVISIGGIGATALLASLATRC